jgi:hypothetical protein
MRETNCISIQQDNVLVPVFSCMLVRNDRVLYKDRKGHSYLLSEQLQNRLQIDVSWRQRSCHRITENNVGNTQLYTQTWRKKLSHKLSVALLRLKKVIREYYAICPKKFPLLIHTSPSNGIILFSAVLSVTSVSRVVRCTPGSTVQSRAHL